MPLPITQDMAMLAPRLAFEQARRERLRLLGHDVERGMAGVTNNLWRLQREDTRQDTALETARRERERLTAEIGRMGAQSSAAEALANERNASGRRYDAQGRMYDEHGGLYGAQARTVDETRPHDVFRAQEEGRRSSTAADANEALANERQAGAERTRALLGGELEAQGADVRKKLADADMRLRELEQAGVLGPLEVEQARAKLRKMQADADVAERKARARPSTHGKPVDRQTAEQLTGLHKSLRLIDELRTLKPKVGTGPIEGPIADAFGTVRQNPDRRQFKSLNLMLQKAVARAIEGNRLTDADMRLYERALTDPSTLDDGEYVHVLNMLDRIVREDLAAIESRERYYGRDTTPFRSSSSPAGSSSPRSVHVVRSEIGGDGLITVQLSNGQSVTVRPEALPRVLERLNGR